jgi:hypothetical protein
MRFSTRFGSSRSGSLILALPLLLVLLVASSKGFASIIPIDLNDFFADPSVTVSADGSSAVMNEDPALSFVLLVNDPFFGDPHVIIAANGTQLLFDYVFDEETGGNDQFRVSVFDSDTGVTVDGFEFIAADNISGSIGFDLSSLVNLTLGLQLELASLFGDVGFGSSVSLSNLRLETATFVSVPEPATTLLLGAGLIGLMAMRVRRQF